MTKKAHQIKKQVKALGLQPGDLTNFGRLIKINEVSITVKAKDTPKTRISYNQRKFGRNEYVLKDLVKL